jgi:hypothetical protein
MGGSVGQQTGWIHLIDLTVAFVFSVPILKTDEAETEPVSAPQMAPGPA